MKIYIQEDPLSHDRTFIGTASNPQEVYDQLTKHFQKKLDDEREKMGIDLKVQEALKTLKEFLK